VVASRLPRVAQVNGPCVVIEACQNCRTHQWNTRHKEEVYIEHAMGLAAAIQKRTGWAVLYNQVPKKWHTSDLYN
jgi:hypothetical protein